MEDANVTKGLVLSFRKGSRAIVQIPQGFSGLVVVETVQIRGSSVRLRFEAPPEVRTDREEVYLQRKAGNAKQS